MSQLKFFVEKLENFELASLYKYRFQSFLESSKKIILTELRKRNISENEIEKYLPKINNQIRQKIKKGEICPRCFSNEFYNSEETENIRFHYETIEYSENYKTCLICLYSQDKINQKKDFWNVFPIIKFFKNRKK